jgi:hypothetical protein
MTDNSDGFLNPPHAPLLENLIKDIIETVMLSFDGDSFDTLTSRDRFHVALACLAVARSAAIAGLGNDSARGWFLHMIEDHWNEIEDS